MQKQSRLSRRASRAGKEPIASVLIAKTLANPQLISLAVGFVDNNTLPVEATRTALNTVLSDTESARSALQYSALAGYAPLRKALLDRMLQADGPGANNANRSVDQVVITPGSNQLIFLLTDVLMDPGDIIICCAPTYYVYLDMLANLGVRAVGVQTDDQGLLPEAVEDELHRRKAAGELQKVKAIYVTSYFDNPTGVTLPASRRGQLVELAKRWSLESKLYIIEDTAYRELRYHGDDVASMMAFDEDGETVITVGSFSKAYSPGIRVGWGVLPPSLLNAVLNEKGNLDFGSPNLNQMMMSVVLEKKLFDAHLQKIRENYREKLTLLLQAADDFLTPLSGVSWLRPTGGLYLWMRLPEHIDTGIAGPLFETAIEEGVLYVPGECCYPAEGAPIAKNMIRLSFGIQGRAEIRQGVDYLARAIRQVL